MSHVSSKKPDSILKILINNHVPQSHDSIRVLVECNDFDLHIRSVSCSQCIPNQGSSSCSKVHHNNFILVVSQQRVYLFLSWFLVLKEPAVPLLVLERLEHRLLVDLVLDHVVLESLVSGTLQVVCQRLQWRLQVVAVAHFHLLLFVQLVMLAEEEAKVLVIRF